MNGRIYDPVLARFMTSDPQVQYVDDLQNYNRYSYVNNNPLGYVDPSGYGFFKKLLGALFAPITVKEFRPIIAIATAAYLGFGDFSWLNGNAVGIFGKGTFETALASGFGGGFVGSGGNLEAGLKGAATAALFYGVGELTGHQPAFGTPEHLANVAGHAAVGCVTSGGNCKAGALAAGFGSFASPLVPESWDFAGKVAAHAAIGGTASVLGGGKFANGAVTSAFGYLFNRCVGSPDGCMGVQGSTESTGYVVGGFPADPAVMFAAEVTTDAILLGTGGIGVRGIHALIRPASLLENPVTQETIRKAGALCVLAASLCMKQPGQATKPIRDVLKRREEVQAVKDAAEKAARQR